MLTGKKTTCVYLDSISEADPLLKEIDELFKETGFSSNVLVSKFGTLWDLSIALRDDLRDD